MPSMEKMAAKMGRPKTAKEPVMYVGVIKRCPFCSSTNVEYKFLNNNKIGQPRYKCVECTKLFTYNPDSRRRRHPQGYLKIASTSTASQELPNNALVSCLNPSCGRVGTSRFLFYNNSRVSQPRYKCGACDTTFTHGGKLSLKRNFEDTTPDVGVCAGSPVSFKRRFEGAMQDVGENGPWLSLRNSEDTTDAAQPKVWRNTKKMNALNNQDFDKNKVVPVEIANTLKLCNWCELPNTTFCKCRKCVLLDYQCQDCCGL